MKKFLCLAAVLLLTSCAAESNPTDQNTIQTQSAAEKAVTDSIEETSQTEPEKEPVEIMSMRI